MSVLVIDEIEFDRRDLIVRGLSRVSAPSRVESVIAQGTADLSRNGRTGPLGLRHDALAPPILITGKRSELLLQ